MNEIASEELHTLREENELMKNDVASKQAEMGNTIPLNLFSFTPDALVNDVTQMLQAEGNKLSLMEQEIQRLQIENERLKKEIQLRPNTLSPSSPTPIVTRRSSATPLPPPPLGGPSSALTISTISEYLNHSLRDGNY
jgi:hypothetical protein